MKNSVRISTFQDNNKVLIFEHPMGLIGYYVKKEFLTNLTKIPYIDNAGFYFLLDNKVIKYVGQGNTRTNNSAVIKRVLEHAEDFWNEVIIFTDKNNSLYDNRRNALNYIESKYINDIGIDILENKTEGNAYIDDKDGIFKADFAISNANFILQIFNITYDKKKQNQDVKKLRTKYDYAGCVGKTFSFTIKKNNFVAKMFCLDTDKWEVKKGTKLRPFSPASDDYVRSLRKEKPISDDELTEDLIFPSANSALSFIYGQYVNAPEQLFDENNVSLSNIAKRIN